MRWTLASLSRYIDAGPVLDLHPLRCNGSFARSCSGPRLPAVQRDAIDDPARIRLAGRIAHHLMDVLAVDHELQRSPAACRPLSPHLTLNLKLSLSEPRLLVGSVAFDLTSARTACYEERLQAQLGCWGPHPAACRLANSGFCAFFQLSVNAK